MHLARIDGDRIAGAGFHHATAAVRFLRPAINDANSELFMGVAWKNVARI
jgi:hypothetical protein